MPFGVHPPLYNQDPEQDKAGIALLLQNDESSLETVQILDQNLT